MNLENGKKCNALILSSIHFADRFDVNARWKLNILIRRFFFLCVWYTLALQSGQNFQMPHIRVFLCVFAYTDETILQSRVDIHTEEEKSCDIRRKKEKYVFWISYLFTFIKLWFFFPDRRRTYIEQAQILGRRFGQRFEKSKLFIVYIISHHLYSSTSGKMKCTYPRQY